MSSIERSDAAVQAGDRLADAHAGLLGGRARLDLLDPDPSAASPPAIPRYARRTRPSRSSSGTTCLAVSTGTAKSIPTSPSASIWELMPITRPRASSSGPPALRALMLASVWITSAMPKPLGRRDPLAQRGDDARGERALETGRVADRHRGVADAHRGGVAELERPGVDVVGQVDAQQREVRVRVRADDPRGHDDVLVQRHRELGRLRDDVGGGQHEALLVDQEARSPPPPSRSPAPTSNGPPARAAGRRGRTRRPPRRARRRRRADGSPGRDERRGAGGLDDGHASGRRRPRRSRAAPPR